MDYIKKLELLKEWMDCFIDDLIYKNLGHWTTVYSNGNKITVMRNPVMDIKLVSFEDYIKIHEERNRVLNCWNKH